MSTPTTSSTLQALTEAEYLRNQARSRRTRVALMGVGLLLVLGAVLGALSLNGGATAATVPAFNVHETYAQQGGHPWCMLVTTTGSIWSPSDVYGGTICWQPAKAS